MKLFCYVLPNCPRCNSIRTARRVTTIAGVTQHRLIMDAFSRGELIKIVDEVGEKNIQCIDCGFSWYEEIYPVKKSKSEIEILQRKLGITKALADEYEKKQEFKRKHKALSFLLFMIGRS